MTFGGEMRRIRDERRMSLRALARRTAYSFGYLGQIERGERTPPGHLALALDYLFSTDGLFQSLAIQNEVAIDRRCAPSEPGRGGATQEGDDVNRKEFIRSAIGLGAALLTSSSRAQSDGDEHDLVTLLTGPTAHYRRMEQSISSKELTPAVEAHLSLARHMGSGLTTPQYFAARAEIAGLSAWLAADRGDHTTARDRYAEAVNCSSRTGNSLLKTYMAASMGAFAVDHGAAPQGILMIHRAEDQVRGDQGVPDSARAWLASLRAVAHAELRDEPAARTALRDAEAYAVRQRGEPRWPWVFTFDEVKVNRYKLTTWARLGHSAEAQEAYANAGIAAVGPKPRALAMLDLADALQVRGELEAACSVASDALRTGVNFDSQRVISRVVLLRSRIVSPSRGTAELDDALDALYRSHS